jgi:hypothetical protein
VHTPWVHGCMGAWVHGRGAHTMWVCGCVVVGGKGTPWVHHHGYTTMGTPLGVGVWATYPPPYRGHVPTHVACTPTYTTPTTGTPLCSTTPQHGTHTDTPSYSGTPTPTVVVLPTPTVGVPTHPTPTIYVMSWGCPWVGVRGPGSDPCVSCNPCVRVPGWPYRRGHPRMKGALDDLGSRTADG